MKHSGQRIIVDPEEIFIEKLDIGKSHIETISITNSMSAPVTIEFKPHPSGDRKHEITPSQLKLSAQETIPVQVKTTLLRTPKYGYIIRDIVNIKSDYFIEKFYISIFPNGYQQEERPAPPKPQEPVSLETKQDLTKKVNENIIKEKDQIITELQSKVHSQSNTIESLVTQFTDASRQEILLKILSLESENKFLCTQLADSRIPPDFSQVYQNNEQLNFELSLKNREIAELQNQLIQLQKSCSIDEFQRLLNAEKEKNFRLEREITEYSQLIKALEQSNKDLQSELNQALQGISSENLTHNLASQTQLVSRLNARLTTMKEREDQALKKLAEAEETIGQLKNSLEEEKPKQGKQMKKPTKSQETQTETEKNTDPWSSFEQHRHEIQIACMSKENTHYQNKYYEVLKKMHQLKLEIGQYETNHLTETTEFQREIAGLHKEIEALQEIKLDYETRLRSYIDLQESLNQKIKEIQRKFEGKENYYKNTVFELENDIAKLKTDLALKESYIQERTSQVAVLLENLEGNYNKENLVAQVSHFKAVEGNLNRQIIELRSSLSLATQHLENELKKQSVLSKKVETLAQDLEKSERVTEDYKKKLEISGENLWIKENETNIMQAQINRYIENEKDYKNRIEVYIKQIEEIQKKHSENICNERKIFSEELVRIKEESEPFDYEIQHNRPLILAINQLLIALKNIENTDEELGRIKERLKGIIIQSDKELFSYIRKNNELEFLLRSSVFFQNLDIDNVQSIEKLNDLIFSLAEELKIWKDPKNMPNPEIYNSRIRLLEKELQERNNTILGLETDFIESKKNCELLSQKLRKIQEKAKNDEIDMRLKEKQQILRLEEEVKNKLRSRDEEIKSYLDSYLTKILSNSPEAVTALELSREVCSLKIFIDELETKLQSETINNELLQKAYNEISEAFYQAENNEEISIKIIEHGPILLKLEQTQNELHKTRESFETRKEENAFLQQKIADLKKEMQALKASQNNVSWKTREVELIQQIKEMKEKHQKEIQALKVNSSQQLKEKIEELEKEYNELRIKKIDSSAENSENQLSKEVQELSQYKKQVQQELLQITGKYNSLQENYNKLNEELEVYKHIVNELGSEPEVKTHMQKGKKLVLDKNKYNQVHRLIRALVAAKLGEADACKKLKKSAENLLTFQQKTSGSEDLIKTLEAKLVKYEKYLKLQKVPLPPSDFLSSNKDPFTEDLEKKIQELEQENQHLRQLELKSWASYSPLSKVLYENEFPADEIGCLIEGIIYLSNLLAPEDHKLDASIERIQRAVIKSLSNLLKKQLKPTDNLASLLEYKPSDTEDRQLWYVELLETQIETLENAIKELIEFTNKTSIEISGNLLSTAQYKGAAMELAKNTKEASNELDSIKSVCMLIKSDLKDIKKPDEGFNADYKERAFMAEAMKRKIEEELLKTKMEHCYNIAELEESEKKLREDNEKIRAQQEHYEKNDAELQRELIKSNNKASKLENELRLCTEKISDSEKKNLELLDAKEKLIKKIEKLQKDQKHVISEAQEQVLGKEKLVAEIQKQNKILQEEKGKFMQEMQAAKKQNRDLRAEINNSKDFKEFEKENKELRRILDDNKLDIRKMTENHRKEIEKMMGVVSELEEKNKVLMSKYHRLKREYKHKSKNKEGDHDVTKLLNSLAKSELEKKNLENNYKAEISNLLKREKEYDIMVEQLKRKFLDTSEKLKDFERKYSEGVSDKSNSRIKNLGDGSDEVVALKEQEVKLKSVIKNLEIQLAVVKEEAQRMRNEVECNFQDDDREKTSRKRK